jgi:hypothetical protein
MGLFTEDEEGKCDEIRNPNAANPAVVDRIYVSKHKYIQKANFNKN